MRPRACIALSNLRSFPVIDLGTLDCGPIYLVRDIERPLRHPLLRLGREPCVVLVQFLETHDGTRSRMVMLTRAVVPMGDETAVAIKKQAVLALLQQIVVAEIKKLLLESEP